MVFLCLEKQKQTSFEKEKASLYMLSIIHPFLSLSFTATHTHTMERQINRTSFLTFFLFLLLSHFNVSISKYLLVFGFTLHKSLYTLYPIYLYNEPSCVNLSDICRILISSCFWLYITQNRFTLSILSIYSMNLLVLICLIYAGFSCQDNNN